MEHTDCIDMGCRILKLEQQQSLLSLGLEVEAGCSIVGKDTSKSSHVGRRQMDNCCSRSSKVEGKCLLVFDSEIAKYKSLIT